MAYFSRSDRCAPVPPNVARHCSCRNSDRKEVSNTRIQFNVDPNFVCRVWCTGLSTTASFLRLKSGLPGLAIRSHHPGDIPFAPLASLTRLAAESNAPPALKIESRHRELGDGFRSRRSTRCCFPRVGTLARWLEDCSRRCERRLSRGFSCGGTRYLHAPPSAASQVRPSIEVETVSGR